MKGRLHSVRYADLSCQSYREQSFAQWPGHAPAKQAGLPASHWTYSWVCGEVIGTPKTCPQKANPGSPAKSRVVFTGDLARFNPRLWSDGDPPGSHSIFSKDPPAP